jgi:hypothetical protein
VDCNQIEELLCASADGELDSELSEQVQKHVKECPRCAALLAEYLAMNEALAKMQLQAPDDLCDKVMAAGREQTAPVTKPARGVRLGRVASWIGVAVAAVLCVSVVSTVLVRHMIKNSDGMDSFPSPEQTMSTTAAENVDGIETDRWPVQEDDTSRAEADTEPPYTDDEETMDSAASPEETTPEDPTEETTTEEITTEEITTEDKGGGMV